MLKHGNVIIGQSGGATAVINASLVGAVQAAMAAEKISGTFGMRNGVEGLLNEKIIDLRQQPASIWQQLLNTPSAALGSCRYKLQEEDLEKIVEILRRYDIRYLLYIGGNDSADSAHKIGLAAQHAGYDLQAISIPKTIDNDLPFTDHCPGYGSAARFIAQATMDSTMNTLSIPGHYPVKIIETMGRNAGWLTAAASLIKREPDDAPHILLMPEQRFNQDRFLARVEEVYRRLGYVVVVVSEAQRDEQGNPLGSDSRTGVDAFQHPLLAGAAQHLVNLVTDTLKIRSRFDKPGDLQRMSSVDISTTDRDEAYLVGKMAVQALLDGQTDKMVTLVRHDAPEYHCTTGLAPLEGIANTQHLMPAEYVDESKMMVTPAFSTYALPLIGAPLPHYPRMENVKVTV